MIHVLNLTRAEMLCAGLLEENRLMSRRRARDPERERHGSPALTRRRTLTMMAATAGLAALPRASWAHVAPMAQWRGTAMGAAASLTIAHPDKQEAEGIIQLAIGELRRLEKIFSLYDPQSSVRRLNETGTLSSAPLELVELTSTALSLSSATLGAFDITVQPLWDLYDQHFSAATPSEIGPDVTSLRRARDLVGYKGVNYDSGSVHLKTVGMALTFNGIAQGYVTDRISSILTDAGLTDVLVDMGEIRGSGSQASGDPWRVGLGVDFTPGGDTVLLSNQAIATSEPLGTVFEATGAFHHLFDPMTGRPTSIFRRLSVIAPTATVADGLSTGLSVASAETLDEVKKSFAGSGVTLKAIRIDGQPLSITF